MLQFRSSQFELLDRGLARDYASRLAAKIRTEEAEERIRVSAGAGWTQVKHLPFEQLLAMVECGLQRVRRYHLEDPADIDAFITLMFSFAPNFDMSPGIHQILTSEDIADADRMDLIAETITEGEWESAVRAYDASAWHQH